MLLSLNRIIGGIRPLLRSRINVLTQKLSESSETKTNENELTDCESKPRRALLYVPADDDRKIQKVSSLEVDSIVLDCEDGVAINRKADARHNILKSLQTLDLGQTECAVRINSVESGFAEEDLKVIFSGQKIPQTILLPKVEAKEHLDWFCEKLVKALGKRKFDVNLITYVESAKGLLDLKDICNHAIEMSEFNLFTLKGIVFGSDDFCASIGATRSNASSETSYARQQVVITAKAFDLQAFDVVYIDYKDLEGLRVQSEEGAKLGFTGKQAIHPSQVPIIQKAFSPSIERIEWASELIIQFNEHQIAGKGAFVFRGQMIDRPLLLQAKNIVQIANTINPNVKPINDSVNKESVT